MRHWKRKRKHLWTFLTALLISTAPALAQSTQASDTGLQPDSKGGILVAPTIVGEVLDIEEHSLLLDTAFGKEYVVRVPQTDVDVALVEGETVAIDFNRTSHGVRVAAQIRAPETADEKAMALMQEDYDAALRGEARFTSTSDGSHKAMARGGKLMGHTLEGTVVSVKKEQIVVSTSTGEETIAITPRTKWSFQPKAGDQVAVDFNRTAHKVPVATEIRELS